MNHRPKTTPFKIPDNYCGYPAETVESLPTNPVRHIRVCVYCGVSGFYDDLPDESMAFVGIMCCGDCVKKEVSRDFREITGEI